MKGVLRAVALLLVVALIGGYVYARGSFQVAVGYSAKQLCSGVFVAGLPQSFVIETDIHPRMAILGPALGQLKLDVDESGGVTEASLLGVSARAVHRAGEGCVLHGSGDGIEPLPLMPASATVAVPRELTDAFSEAFKEPAGGGRNTLAVLVLKDGELIAEQYAAPVTAGNRLQAWSMNKSLMSTWVGLQTQAGAIDPTVPAREQVARVIDGKRLDRRLTLLHLLQMESGLDFEEVYGPGSDVTRMLYTAETMWELPAGAGQAYAPGQRFAYSSGDTVLASHLWQESLDEPYYQWVEKNFSAPLGIESLVAEADASGTQVGSSYAYMTARDWATAGQMWLDAWHGRSDLLSQGWMRASSEARPSDPKGQYGRGFWLNTGEVAFEGVPENVFYAAGNAGQFVVMLPEQELVVVRLGLTSAGTSSGISELLRGVLAAQGEG